MATVADLEVGDFGCGEDFPGVSVPFEEGRDCSIPSVEEGASDGRLREMAGVAEEGRDGSPSMKEAASDGWLGEDVPAVRADSELPSCGPERVSFAASPASDNSPVRSRLYELAASVARPRLAKSGGLRKSVARPRTVEERRLDSSLLQLHRGVRLNMHGGFETAEVVFMADESGFWWHGDDDDELPHSFNEVVSVSAAFFDRHELRIVTIPETKAQKQVRRAHSLDAIPESETFMEKEFPATAAFARLGSSIVTDIEDEVFGDDLESLDVMFPALASVLGAVPEPKTVHTYAFSASEATVARVAEALQTLHRRADPPSESGHEKTTLGTLQAGNEREMSVLRTLPVEFSTKDVVGEPDSEQHTKKLREAIIAMKSKKQAKRRSPVMRDFKRVVARSTVCEVFGRSFLLDSQHRSTIELKDGARVRLPHPGFEAFGELTFVTATVAVFDEAANTYDLVVRGGPYEYYAETRERVAVSAEGTDMRKLVLRDVPRGELLIDMLDQPYFGWPWFVLGLVASQLAVYFSYVDGTDRVRPIVLAFRTVDEWPGCRDTRSDAWRYITYKYLHGDLQHVLFNSLVLLVLGVPIEFVHGSWPILAVVESGSAVGALACAMFSPDRVVVGSSAAVFCLVGVHVANVGLNWTEMRRWGFASAPRFENSSDLGGAAKRVDGDWCLGFVTLYRIVLWNAAGHARRLELSIVPKSERHLRKP